MHSKQLAVIRFRKPSVPNNARQMKIGAEVEVSVITFKVALHPYSYWSDQTLLCGFRIPHQK